MAVPSLERKQHGVLEAGLERLHELGWAHSVETYVDGQLVGGLYGVSIGGAFFGESMFSTVTDASKVALVHLVAVTLSGPPPESIARGEQGCMTLIPAAALLGLLLVMGTCTPAPVVNMLNAATNIVLDRDTATAQIQPALREMVRSASQEAVAPDAARQTSSRQEI